MLLATLASATAPWWEHAYEGGALPEQALPSWEKVQARVQGGMTITEACRGGVLRLTHTGRNVNRYFQLAGGEAGSSWRGQSELGTTLEIRMRVVAPVSGVPYALGIFLLGLKADAQTHAAALQAGRRALTFMGKEHSLDLSDFHTLRVTFDPVREKSFGLYLDGSAMPVVKVPITDGTRQPPNDPRNTVLFGTTFAPSMQGTVEIDYIRWTHRGALAPSGADGRTENGTQEAPMMVQAKPKPTPPLPGAATEAIERGRNLVDRWSRWPLIAVPRISRAPDIDGRLDSNEWAAAASFTGLIDYQTDQASAKSSRFYLCRSDDAIFLGFHLARLPGMAPRVTASEPVASLWNADDGLEVCVSCDTNFRTVFSLYGNGASGCSDGFAFGDAFDSTPRFGWVYRSRTLPDGIEGELKIPADAFDEQLRKQGCQPRPLQAGDEWRLNVMRVDVLPEKEQEDWSRMWGDAYDGARLGRLVFPRRDTAVRIERVGAVDTGQVGWIGAVHNGADSSVRLKVEYEVYRASTDLVEKRFNLMRTWDLIERFRKEGPTIEGIPLADQISEEGHLGVLGGAYAILNGSTSTLEVAAGQELPLHIAVPAPPGQFLLALRITNEGDGTRLYEQVLPVNVSSKMEVRLTRRFLMKGGVEVRTRLAADSGIAAGANLKFSVVPAGAKENTKPKLSWEENVGSGSDQSERFVDLGSLRVGSYELRAVAVDHTGKRLASAQVPFRKPSAPDWWRNKIGRTDKVLPPWTPVEVKPSDTQHRTRVSVWGRTFQFQRQAPFPVQITCQGRELLAAPISLEAAAGGRTVGPAGTLRLLSAAPHAAVYESRIAGEGVEIVTTMTVEFDGLLRFVMDVRAGTPLERLVLSVPVRRDAVTHWGGSYFGTDLQTASYGLRAGRIESLASAFPRGELGFAGLFQFSDDLGALQWICEEDRNWENSDRARAMEAVADVEKATLRVRFIDKPTPIEGTRRYSWALMPTPVKPIDYQLNMDLMTMNGMPSGLPGQPWEPEKLERYFEDCRRHGITHVMYGGFGPPFHADV
ncbi:MAG: DUF6067 family protein, partial [Kiritimatiellae bacterium]|nr:DUF6067 family protein [Kiritimatiellia bacterium]